MMTIRENLPVIPDDDRELLVELSNELFTHLLESKALSDPREAQVIAAAFLVDSYERGWRFTRCMKKEEDSSKELAEEEEEKEENQQGEDTNTG